MTAHDPEIREYWLHSADHCSRMGRNLQYPLHRHSLSAHLVLAVIQQPQGGLRGRNQKLLLRKARYLLVDNIPSAGRRDPGQLDHLLKWCRLYTAANAHLEEQNRVIHLQNLAVCDLTACGLRLSCFVSLRLGIFRSPVKTLFVCRAECRSKKATRGNNGGFSPAWFLLSPCKCSDS